jgi:hypothetical protein
MAQKFTIDPRLQAGGTMTANADDDSDSGDESSPEETTVAEEAKRPADMTSFREKLAAARAAALAGETCTMCSS